MVWFVDEEFAVVSGGGVAYNVTIQIDNETWTACDGDVQAGVLNILAAVPIQLLSASGKGNGIKQESKGLEFHTQTDKRLQFPGGTIKDKTFTFDRYGKGWGH
ncbi:hypothetical protein [Rheinheimera sp.]|uniref:hypothetical protein n=1 Tax=Rheinheimera sp. TaxID=1869214 RepID=UPI0027B8E627|nr:hypothetical protein [Rheinheimera sp.]